MLNEILFVLLVGLNLVDVYTTVRVLRQGGSEMNPIMAWTMDKLGVIPGLLLPKIVVLGAIWFYLPLVPVLVMFGLCCFYLLLVLHNNDEIKK